MKTSTSRRRFLKASAAGAAAVGISRFTALSYAQIAEQWEVSQGQVERFLSPTNPSVPPTEVLARLHTSFGVPLNFLLCGSGRGLMRSTDELEKEIRAWVVLNLESHLGWGREYAWEQVATLGRLLPQVLRNCHLRITRRRATHRDRLIEIARLARKQDRPKRTRGSGRLHQPPTMPRDPLL